MSPLAGRAALLAGGLLDDAAVFPPGEAPLDVALGRHGAYRRGPLAAVVGPLVLADRHLGGLTLDAPLDVALVVPAGVPAVPTALAAAARVDGLQVVAVEAPAGTDVGGTDLVRDAARRLRAAVDPAVPAYLEIGWGESAAAGVDAAAAAGARVKLRTGGLVASAVPAVAALAGAIVACVRAGVPFKCTAGLHHAVAFTDPATGIAHHGFLGVLLATCAALAGDDDAAAPLRLRDAAEVAAQVAALSDAELADARAAFVSFGTCSVSEPVEDLVTLGLLPAGSVPTGSAPTEKGVVA